MHRIKVEPNYSSDGTRYSVDGDVVCSSEFDDGALQHILEYLGKKCTFNFAHQGEEMYESYIEDATNTILVDVDADGKAAYFVDDHFVIKSNSFDEVVLSILQKFKIQAICETRIKK